MATEPQKYKVLKEWQLTGKQRAKAACYKMRMDMPCWGHANNDDLLSKSSGTQLKNFKLRGYSGYAASKQIRNVEINGMSVFQLL